ncbi:MAG: holo-ACP synthase [Chloroflexi bacterium]|uniref:Holo-[acyl-carrier-protein] synthase n=1 Tax=Candidatus Chlorohelix allophototropha TaxID=3003348 RepID=A0A8T7M2E0_9CHLR|nr:holo-ACP synthase [Chloroflexota bacterium]WJW65949.1 holo-ACP synthase [Chloroflexota bacterium L227-S17]
MLECGVDLVEIARIEQAVARLGERFLNRIYTEREREYCRGRAPQLAARFAAKEATAKILGTGLWRQGVSWHQIEVVNDLEGKPHLNLSGEAAKRAEKLGLSEWSISISHSRGDAIAFVVAMGN